MKRIKRITAFFLTLAIISTSFVTAYAVKNISVLFNGKQMVFDVQPTIINGRTMVPVRAIFEALGATVNWNGTTRTVTATRQNTTVKLTIDNRTMYVNNTAKNLDVPAMILSGRTLVPLRAVSESFNCQVGWDGKTNVASIVDDVTIATMLYSANNRSFAVLNPQINDYLRSGWYRDSNLTDNAIQPIPTDNDKIRFLKLIRLAMEAQTNAYRCLQGYSLQPNAEFISVFYESINTAKKITEDAYSMSLKYKDMSTMNFDLTVVLNVYNYIIENNDYSTDSLLIKLNRAVKSFESILEKTKLWL